MTELSPLANLNKGLTVLGEVREDLDETRAKIKSLTDERAGLERVPVAKEEMIGRVDAWLDKICGREDGPIPSWMPPIIPFFMRREVKNSVELPYSDLAFRRFLLTVNRAQIRAYYVDKIERLYAIDPGIPAEERQAKLAKLDEELLELELAEEALIRGADRMGVTLLGRADADPRAVLASDETLESLYR